jgi:hypothetical protein
VRDLSLVGRGWNAETGLLAMGTIPRADGVAWPLLIVIRGPHAEHARLQHVGSNPKCLAVEFEPTRYVAETGISLTRMTIRIAPGSPPSEHLGNEHGALGHITLQTDPPSSLRMDLQVRFAIGE